MDPRAIHDTDMDGVRAQLLGIVRRRCPRWLADQAEDIVQSALLRALDAYARQGRSGEVSMGYLITTAKHALIDEIRRKFRRVEVSLDDDAIEAPPPSATVDGERVVRSNAIDRGLRDCLSILAPARRHAVTLHLLGHSSSEATTMLAQSKKSVEHLTYRGLSDLRDCLQEKGLQP
ncbi:MAG: RNA polymerase sigma factor [Acidobacteriota bacterium]